MSVTVDVVTTVQRTVTDDPWTTSHAGGASPQGVAVFANDAISATQKIVGMTYGGVTVPKIVEVLDGSSVSMIGIWFLGVGVPAGTQNLVVDFTLATGDDFQFVIATLDGDGDLEVVDFDSADVAATTDPAQLTLQYGGKTCMAFAVVAHQENVLAEIVENADQTNLVGFDWGFECVKVSRQTTAGSSDFTIGWTDTTEANEHAIAACAISEVVVVRVAPNISQTFPRFGPGFGRRMRKSEQSVIAVPAVEGEGWEQLLSFHRNRLVRP